MEFLTLDLEINPWENRSYEIIARPAQGDGKTFHGSITADQVLWNSARVVANFPLSPSALDIRLPILRSTLSQMDLAAGRANTDEERGVTEFAGLLHDFIFTGDILRAFSEARTAAVSQWKGLRLRLRVSAPDLQSVPWEILWEILAFDLQSMRRGLFDLHVERIAPHRLRASMVRRPPAGPLHPISFGPHHQDMLHLIRQADAAFYSPDFNLAIERYKQCLQLEPSLRQARECLARAETWLSKHQAATTVPPRAAAGYKRAWDTYTQYRFDEALRWLNEAWLLAKDWGVTEWPEASTFQSQIERSRSGYANYQEGIARYEEGNLTGALEAVEQAFRADPLEVYHAQLEDWWQIFEIGKESTE